jgi:hypothetical protein
MNKSTGDVSEAAAPNQPALNLNDSVDNVSEATSSPNQRFTLANIKAIFRRSINTHIIPNHIAMAIVKGIYNSYFVRETKKFQPSAIIILSF